MSEQPLQRRLAALICADVVGYSRLISDDEIDTARSMTACRNRVTEVVRQNGGRLVDFVGDNMLAEFVIRLYPMYPSFYSTILATAYYGDGRYEEAIASAEISLSIDSHNLSALLVIAGANAALNRMEEAHRASREVLRMHSRFSLREYVKSQPYKDPQYSEKMVAMLQKADCQNEGKHK